MTDSHATQSVPGKLLAPLHHTRTLLERLVRNRRSVARDLGLVARNARSLPWIIFPLRSDDEARPEFDPDSYQSRWEYLSVVGQVLLPVQRESASEGTRVVLPPNYVWPPAGKNSKWFFLNGICTAPPMALLEAEELAKAFYRPIHLIHTPTYGAVWDLWDAITARTLRKDGKLARPAFNIVKNALLTHEHVVLLSYSQGTIISSYIVRKILKDPVLREHAHKLEIYCLAGVADSMHIDYQLTAEHGHPVPYVEHFANGQDFFARIGVLSHYYATSGPVFVLPEKKGHMLTDHYIPGIRRGDYCQGRSRLNKYVGGLEPTDKDYIAFDRRS
ncbi:MAG TPA: hypothetical protein DF427_09090 [Moraxellaceae bacterium]|nr:hypothetical protein [Moraxellaceae bacterium]